MPVGLRPKGRVEPLFSNQVDMLMVQFLPEHLESVETAVAALKAQTAQASARKFHRLRTQTLGTVQFFAAADLYESAQTRIER